MAVSNKNVAIVCFGAVKRCNNKSKQESNEETAFKHAQKQGWSKVKVTNKCTRYYCASCTHKLSLGLSRAINKLTPETKSETTVS